MKKIIKINGSSCVLYINMLCFSEILYSPLKFKTIAFNMISLNLLSRKHPTFLSNYHEEGVADSTAKSHLKLVCITCGLYPHEDSVSPGHLTSFFMLAEMMSSICIDLSAVFVVWNITS